MSEAEKAAQTFNKGPRVARTMADAFLAGAAWQRERDAARLKDAAEHHLKQDAHAAFDPTRFEEKCDEHGGYHSYPGYAAHVVDQMAKVIGEDWPLPSEVAPKQEGKANE